MGKQSMYDHFPLHQDIYAAHKSANQILLTKL